MPDDLRETGVESVTISSGGRSVTMTPEQFEEGCARAGGGGGLILDKASFEAHRIAIKPDPKSGEIDPLQLVQITPTEVRATNGRMIVRIQHLEAEDGLHPPRLEGPVCLTRAAAQSLAQDAGRHDAVQIDETDDQWVRFVGMDKIGGPQGLPMWAEGEFRVVPAAEPSRPYPNIAGIPMPKGKPRATITLDSGLLADLAAIAKSVAGSAVGLQLEIWGEADVVRATIPSDKRERLLALVMPMATPDAKE